MNQKHVTLAACLLAFGLTVQAQDGGISPDMLKKIQSSYQNTAADKALRNAMGGTSIKELALNQENQKALNTDFSIKVESKGITDQQSSGRCWLFTGLNVMRAKAIARYDSPGHHRQHGLLPGLDAGIFFLLGPAGKIQSVLAGSY